MLWSSLDRKLRQIPRAAKGTPGGRPVSGAQAEQSLKRGHRGPPPVVAKDELVQIDLQVSAANSVGNWLPGSGCLT